MVQIAYKNYPLSITVATIITIISLIPIPEVPQLQNISLLDKWVHFVMYGTLSFVIWCEYLYRHKKTEWAKTTIGAVMAPIVMSGILELMQAYCTTCRSGDWLDFVANSIGVAIVSVPCYIWSFQRR